MKYGVYLEKLLQAARYNSETAEGYRAVLTDIKDDLLNYNAYEKISDIIFAVIKHDFQGVVKCYSGNTTKLATDLQIPVSSFYNWVQGTRQPPQYLLQLVGYTIIQQMIEEEGIRDA